MPLLPLHRKPAFESRCDGIQNPHCVFSHVGYENGEPSQPDGGARPPRRWVFTRDARHASTVPLLYAGGASEWYTFPPCYVASAPRGAMQHETYCFSPRVELATTPRKYRTFYERGVILSWSGGIGNFGHMVVSAAPTARAMLGCSPLGAPSYRRAW